MIHTIRRGGAHCSHCALAPTRRRGGAAPLQSVRRAALTRISRSVGVLLCLVAGTRCRSSTTRCAHVGVLSVWVCSALLDFVNHFREGSAGARSRGADAVARRLSVRAVAQVASHCGQVASFRSLRCALHWQLAAAVPRVVPESGRHLSATCAPPVRHLCATCAPMPTLHC
jgi:hypothetical protein